MSQTVLVVELALCVGALCGGKGVLIRVHVPVMSHVGIMSHLWCKLCKTKLITPFDSQHQRDSQFEHVLSTFNLIFVVTQLKIFVFLT